MNENKAIAKTQPQQGTGMQVIDGNFRPNSISKIAIGDVRELADIFVASGQFPDVKSVAQAAVKIIAGNELGFTPIVAMTGIHFFQGKVEFSSTLKASLIKDSGRYDYKITESSNEACTIVFYQKVGAEMKQLGVPIRYTIEDAANAKLTSKDNWTKFPSDMLFAACIRQGTRRYCADVLRGTESDHDSGFADDLSLPEPVQIAAASVVTTPNVPPPAETVTIEGEVVDTATGEVIEPDDERAAIEAESDDAPLFTGDEAALVDLRTAVTDVYNSTKGESRARANKLLGVRTIGALSKTELAELLDGLNDL